MSGGDTSFLPGPGDQPILQQLPRGPKPVVFAAGTRCGRCRSILLTMAGKPNLSEVKSPPAPLPPITRTLPSARRTAACWNLASVMPSIAVNLPVSGSYISTVASPVSGSTFGVPPVNITSPVASKVAVCHLRRSVMNAAGRKPLVARSKSPALSVSEVNSTLPLFSTVASALPNLDVRPRMVLNLPDEGSKSSGELGLV